MILRALMLVCCCALWTGCGRRAESVPAIAPPQSGGLYSLSDGEGGHRVGKVVVMEDDIVFVELFSERWPQRPSLAETKTVSRPMFIAYLDATFKGMQPVLLESRGVTADELEQYEQWKRSKGEVF